MTRHGAVGLLHVMLTAHTSWEWRSQSWDVCGPKSYGWASLMIAILRLWSFCLHISQANIATRKHIRIRINVCKVVLVAWRDCGPASSNQTRISASAPNATKKLFFFDDGFQSARMFKGLWRPDYLYPIPPSASSAISLLLRHLRKKVKLKRLWRWWRTDWHDLLKEMFPTC